MIAIARVTVRANIERLVGGAGEETIIAGSAKARSPRSVRPTATRWCSRIPTPSRGGCSSAASTPEPLTRSCQSISPT